MTTNTTSIINKVLATLGLLILATSVHAGHIFLDGYRSGALDTNNGLTPAMAVKTFAKAKSLISPGDTIFIYGCVSVTTAETWDLSGYGAGGTGPGIVMRWVNGLVSGITEASYQAVGAGSDNTHRGLVAVQSSGDLTLSNIIIDGGSQCNGGTFSTGEAYSILLWSREGGNLTMSQNCTLRNNRKNGNCGGALASSGGTITMEQNATIDNCECGIGAGVFIDITSFLYMNDNCSITNCKATDIGGGIYIKDGSISISGAASIANNTATKNGGGIYIDFASASVSINGTASIANNTAVNGGGIFSNKGTVSLSGTASITNNSVTTYGGGLFNSQGITTISGTVSITNNAAAKNGGGIYNNTASASTSINGTASIASNSAAIGGGLFSNNGTISISGAASITNNTTTTDGGGIRINAGTASISGTASIANNNSASGGGIYIYGGTVSTSGTASITNNTATTVNGGGIYFRNGTLNVEGNTLVKGNTSALTPTDNDVYLPNTKKISVTNALTTPGNIGVVTTPNPPASGNHKILYEFAQGSGYTVTDNDALAFFDDYHTLTIEKSPGSGDGTDNTIRFRYFKVNYDGNSQTSGANWTESPVVGATVTVANNIPPFTKTGATFWGWSGTQIPAIVTSATDTVGKGFTAVGSTFTMPTSDTTFYAIWAIDVNGNTGTPDGIPDFLQHSVTYNLNGGSGTTPTDNNIYSPTQTVTVKDTAGLGLTIAGGVFDGWSTTAITSLVTAATDTAGKGFKGVSPLAQFNITSDTTLFAVWAADTNGNGIADYRETPHNVTYNLNGGSGTTPTDASSPYLMGLPVTVLDTLTGTSKTNAFFIGWSKIQIPTDITAASDTVGKGFTPAGTVFSMPTSDVTFYAIWAADKYGPDSIPDGVPDYLQYKLMYNPNGGSGNVPDTTAYNPAATATVVGNIKPLTMTGYAFDGWTTTPHAPVITIAGKPTNILYAGDVLTMNSDSTLYALWGIDANGNGVPDYDEPEHSKVIPGWTNTTPGWTDAMDANGIGSWYPSCAQTLTLKFPADCNNERKIKLHYTNAAVGHIVAPDGTKLPTEYTMAKCDSIFSVDFATTEVPEAMEGTKGAIIVEIVGGGRDTAEYTFYNHATFEAKYIPRTTGFTGRLDIGQHGGSPYMMRSVDGGLTWKLVSAGFTLSELANMENTVDIMLKEPYSCWSAVISLEGCSSFIPEIAREVWMQPHDGVTTNPQTNAVHYVKSHDNFNFTATFADGEPLIVVVTYRKSGTQEVLEPTKNADGTYSYTVHQVVEPITITFGSPVSNEFIEVDNVWAYDGTLHVETLTAKDLRIYSIGGNLVRQQRITAGHTQIPLMQGFYIVHLDEKTYKVVLK